MLQLEGLTDTRLDSIQIGPPFPEGIFDLEFAFEADRPSLAPVPGPVLAPASAIGAEVSQGEENVSSDSRNEKNLSLSAFMSNAAHLRLQAKASAYGKRIWICRISRTSQ